MIIVNGKNHVLNATIHVLTKTQIEDGGVEPPQDFKNSLKEELLIVGIPTRKELAKKARSFALKLEGYIGMHYGHMAIKPSILIGSGTPSMQPMIVRELDNLGIHYVYSHSDRECVETHNPDGTVTKQYIFEHKGWY